MNFEIINKFQINDTNNIYEAHSFIIFRETSTDILWIKHENSFSEMHDPETGLPLTYKVWQEKYQNK